MSTTPIAQKVPDRKPGARCTPVGLGSVAAVRAAVLLIAASAPGLVACASSPEVGTFAEQAAPLVFPPQVKVRRHPDTGAILRIAALNLSAALEQQGGYQALMRRHERSAMALAFLSAYRREFGMADPAAEFVVARVDSDTLGFHQVRLAQRWGGLPVHGAELIVQFDRDEHINLLRGDYLPTPARMSPVPAQAMAAVRQRLTLKFAGGAEVDAGRPLVYWDATVPARLAYEFHITRSLVDQRQLIVDANDGRVLLDVPTVVQQRTLPPDQE